MHQSPINHKGEPDLVIIQVYITNAYRAYKEFYLWSNIFKAGFLHDSHKHKLKHLCYTGGWKKFEPVRNFLIKSKHLNNVLPLLVVLK